MNFFSNFDFDLKVVVLGHISTGKSSFVNRLTQDIYIENPISTNNVQFYEKRIIVTYENDKIEEFKENQNKIKNDFEEEDSSQDNEQIKKSTNDNINPQAIKEETKKYVIRLKIWDTAGAERYMSITKSYLRESNIILLFFDINSRDSFLDLDKHWWQMLSDGGYVETSVIILICNKCDLNQTVTDEEIKKFCEDHNDILNIKVSPKEGTNVTEVIFIALQEYFKIIKCNKLVSVSTNKVDLGEPLDEKNELIEEIHPQAQSGWSYWCKC